MDISVNKPVQSLTCILRQVSGFGFPFPNEQNCESKLTFYGSKMLAYSYNFVLQLYFLGSSMSIVYPNLNAGKYVLRVVGNAATGETAEIRRQFRIGNSYHSNYHSKIVSS